MDDRQGFDKTKTYQFEYQFGEQHFHITVVQMGINDFFAYADQRVSTGDYIPRGYGTTGLDAFQACVESIKVGNRKDLPVLQDLEWEQEDPQYDFFDPEHKRMYDQLRDKVKAWVEGKIPAKYEQYTEYLLLAPDMFVLLVRLVRDNRVSPKSKTWIVLAITYFLSPIDLIPEAFFPVIGLLDDLAVAAYALNKVLHDTPPEVVEANWSGQGDILQKIEEIIEKADDMVGKRVVNGIMRIFEKKKV